MTTAGLMKKAASILREQAEAVRVPGSWGSYYGDEDTECLARMPGDHAYIAVIPPAVGLALADWLEYQSYWHESRDAYGYSITPDTAAARGIARLIVGERP